MLDDPAERRGTPSLSVPTLRPSRGSPDRPAPPQRGGELERLSVLRLRRMKMCMDRKSQGRQQHSLASCLLTNQQLHRPIVPLII